MPTNLNLREEYDALRAKARMHVTIAVLIGAAVGFAIHALLF